MNGENKEQWYSNKELFEMVQELKDELRETRDAVKKHNLNGVKDDLNWCIMAIKQRESKQEGHYNLLEGFREWGGWVALIIFMLYTIFG